MIPLKHCSSCGEIKPVTEFPPHKHAKDGRYSKCRECKREAYNEEYRRLKDEIFTHYGGYICAYCGADEPDTMEIDHVCNDGVYHRQSEPYAGKNILRYLKRNNFPEGYQVLCRRCNFQKWLDYSKATGQKRRLIRPMPVNSPGWKKQVKQFCDLLGGAKAVLPEILSILHGEDVTE